jgi:hypothetical protein
VAWCQYGTPEELPNIYHRKEYEAGLDKLPDYRLTCFFVDRKYRRKGMAAVALRGALQLIAQAGGGVVEAYPQDTDGKKISASFLYNATRSLRSPVFAVRCELNAGFRGELVGDGAGVAGHGRRGGVDLVDEQSESAGGVP